MPPVTEYHQEEVVSEPLPTDHVYTYHVHPWEEIVGYVCKSFSLSPISTSRH